METEKSNKFHPEAQTIKTFLMIRAEGADIALRLEKIGQTFSSFNLCPS